ncbi:MAG: putative 4-hydroxybenzoate polyprenyltransferase [Thermoplasmata archaeon]|nr:putative 4-hydroxybenzoate polyprenyltransferase [Thermoplasmata archaeon]
MTEAAPGARFGLRDLGRFLEIQNLGLNLPFAIGFLLLAAHGLPSLRTLLLIVVAFVAARNAGHSFNRWVDRGYDARNPRTQGRALVIGRTSPAFAVGFTVLMAAVFVLAAALLNPLAALLAPLALGAIFLYSYTKRFTAVTTAYLGFVEGITPAAVFIAVTGTLPWAGVAATLAILAWGTAFETIHSLGDVEADHRAGLHSIPVRIGVRPAIRLLPLLHGVGLLLLAAVGYLLRLNIVYFLGIVGMTVVASIIDAAISRDPARTDRPFRLHFLGGAFFLVGVAGALFVALPL